MQQPPFDPPQQPYQQPTQPYPQPGQYAPGLQPPPRRTSKRKIGCIIASSIGGGLLFLLTLCIIIGSLFPPPKNAPGDNPFVVPTFASNATPTPGKTATQNVQVQATAPSTPTTVANSITPTLAPTPTTAPVPTPTAVPPTLTPIPTPTPRPGPSRAQVDELAETLYSLQPKVKSYDEKTGTLVLDLFSGSAIVVDPDFVKDNIQKVHEHFWQKKLYFSSITVESYHNRKDGPAVKLASGKMTWATASTIDWGALFGVGDLWDRYDEKWMSTNQADYDGQGL